MNSPCRKHNLPAGNIDQIVYGIWRWLVSEQSALSHYFDHHPCARHSFLEAVHRVSGRESLVTPVATPAENAVDDKRTVSSSREVGNQIGPITHYEVRERAYNETSIVENELHGDLKDVPLRIQRPLLNSSETNKTSQRLTAQVCSTTLNGTLDTPIINEHRNKPLQAHVDKYVEQTSKDDQPYPTAPPTGSDRSLNLESSSHNSPEAVPAHQAKRKRKRPASSETGALSTLPCGILDRWKRITGPETLTGLWHCLYAEAWVREPESTLKTTDLSDTSIEGQLKIYYLQYQRGNRGASKKYKPLAKVTRRLFFANIIGFYMQLRAAPKKRKRGRNADTASTPRISLFNTFVNFFLPELLKEDTDTLDNAKTRFSNWIQSGKRWAKLVERFGSGILLLIPEDLSNEDVKNITLPQWYALVEYLDSDKPSLRADIQNLTSLLTPLIEDQRLPDRRLKLEMLTESQITSGEHVARSLKELLEFSDNCSSSPAETPRSDVSHPITEASTSSLMSFGEQASSSTALPDPPILDQDQGITSYTDLLFLSSPLDPWNIDWLREDF